MSDSIDRVFVHALNTVKKIPRTGTARPPPADRLKLYGLYKQSMEGDVDGVMERPRGEGDEIRSEQEKWDAWNFQKGLSRTEAKRQYISTLIETMHRYASNTPDSRELVLELEFVWDQIKGNSPSTSSGHSYPGYAARRESASLENATPIYPVMSEGGSRNPRGPINGKPLRVMSPVSQNQTEPDPSIAPIVGQDDEEFVDAPDSRYDENEDQSVQSPVDKPPQGIIAAIKSRTVGTNTGKSKPQDMARWHRRIESAIIKVVAEMAALREQLEMQQQEHRGSVYSAISPFRPARRGDGILRQALDYFVSITTTVAKHLVFDAVLLAAIALYLRYLDIPTESMEKKIHNVVQWLQHITFLKYFNWIRRSVPKSVTEPLAFMPPRRNGRTNG